MRFTHAQALQAIQARLVGNFDDQELMRLGPLGDIQGDIGRILAAAAKPRMKGNA
jgi:hypothetical protein